MIQKLLEENKQWIDETWEKMENKLQRTSVSARHKLPRESVNGVFDDHSSKGGSACWTNGFWPGIMWLMYAATGKENYKETAEYGEEVLDMALENFKCLHHDVGFMWILSSGANYKLTGNEKSKNRMLHAASVLASRYHVNGQFINAWNDEGFEGYVIIDCMMNIPLLYWASEQTNNPSFKQIAMCHADTCLKYHIRPDGSVYHILNYDLQTGEPEVAPLTQGYEPTASSWSRGQSWALYGYVLSYLHTGEQRYLDVAKQVAHYFIAAVCNDGYIPRLDFRQPDEPHYIDSSAGAIAACGLIEMAKVVPEYEKRLYMQAAIQMMKALAEKECDWSDEEDSILQNSSSYYGEPPHSYIFGDYYFVEAMCKLKGLDVLFW